MEEKKLQPGDRMAMLCTHVQVDGHSLDKDPRGIYFLRKTTDDFGEYEPFDYVQGWEEKHEGSQLVVLEFLEYHKRDNTERRVWRMVNEER